MNGRAVRPAGSPSAGGPVFLEIGKVRRPHGVHGDVLVEVHTDFPERLQPERVIYAGEDHLPLTIERRRPHKDGLLLAFGGYTTPEQVGRFRNQVLYSSASDRPELQDGEYYFHELIGLAVEDETGTPLGKLTEIMETGANDVYVVTGDDGGELLLPAISEVILEVDLAAKTMRVHLLPGLVESEEEDA